MKAHLDYSSNRDAFVAVRDDNGPELRGDLELASQKTAQKVLKLIGSCPDEKVRAVFE